MVFQTQELNQKKARRRLGIAETVRKPEHNKTLKVKST